MISKISGFIASKLHEKGFITEEDFTTYDYMIGTSIFGVMSTSSFVLVGFLIGQPRQMIISMVCLWTCLQVWNYTKQIHALIMLNCFLITLTHLLISVFGTLALSGVLWFENCGFIYSSMISSITVLAMISRPGVKVLRWIEHNIFIWTKNHVG